MKTTCVHCKLEMENPAGFHLNYGFVCMRHEGERIKTYTVLFPGMGDIVFSNIKDAEKFIEDDSSEGLNPIEEYKIKQGEMDLLEFYNLDEWEG